MAAWVRGPKNPQAKNRHSKTPNPQPRLPGAPLVRVVGAQQEIGLHILVGLRGHLGERFASQGIRVQGLESFGFSRLQDSGKGFRLGA